LPVLVLALLLFIAARQGHTQPAVEVLISGDLTESHRRNIRSFLSLARLPENEPLSEAVFNRLYAKAPKEVAKALEPFGYYTPDITLSQRRKDSHRVVELVIATGLPVTISAMQIVVKGPGEQDEQLQKGLQHFPLHPGDVLDHQLYEEGKDALIALALEQGYQQAAFHNNRVEVSRKAHSATVSMHLETGPRYLFGPLTFKADFIDHDLLRKIAPVREGDPFSPKALTRLRQSLFNANYFDTVDVEYDLNQATTAKIPVTIVLTPNLAHKYGIGLGYGTDTGPRGTFEYVNRHINRFGHQLDLLWQPSERKSNLGTVYTIPIGDPQKDRLTLTGKYETEQFANTDTETLNAVVSHDHFRERGEYSSYVQFLDEHYTIGSTSDQAALLIPGVKGSIFWADDRIVTKQGLRLTATAIGSEETVLADTNFVQATLRAKGIYTFWDQWRIIGRSDIGTTLVDDIDDLPPSLRFYAGGDQSVRGYGYKTIGPTDADGNLLGGKNLLTYSMELERSLFDEWSGAVFYDSGSAMNSFSQVTLHSGAGVGLRWNGVFGQIRLDLAKSLDEEGAWRIHFTMGADL
jgi:translocation and assembly module TamA